MIPRAVLDYWFGTPGAPEYGRPRACWFRKDPAFDRALTERFGELHARAAAGALVAWKEQPDSALALVIVLDQFSRNLHRDRPAAFDCDEAALALAKSMLAKGWDRSLLPVMRIFVYLPFEHSEDLADQELAVHLFTALERESGLTDLVRWAERHREVIRRFGRFPHRNAVLGRPSTDEERAFLAAPGSRF